MTTTTIDTTYYVKYLQTGKRMNKKKKIENIIEKNREYKTQADVPNSDEIAYNL